ncbi:unnamed protein product [Gadus morhua 'NCC']
MSVEQLLRIVAPSIAKLDTKFRQAISPEDGSAFVYGTWQQEILSGLLRFASGWVASTAAGIVNEWRVYRRVLGMSPKVAENIVKATCMLKEANTYITVF